MTQMPFPIQNRELVKVKTYESSKIENRLSHYVANFRSVSISAIHKLNYKVIQIHKRFLVYLLVLLSTLD